MKSRTAQQAKTKGVVNIVYYLLQVCDVTLKYKECVGSNLNIHSTHYFLNEDREKIVGERGGSVTMSLTLSTIPLFFYFPGRVDDLFDLALLC